MFGLAECSVEHHRSNWKSTVFLKIVIAFATVWSAGLLGPPAHCQEFVGEELLLAVKRGDLTLVSELSERSTDNQLVDYRDSSGNTLLHWAARWQRLELARWLIANGAEINAVNDLDATPLICATGQLDVTRLLVEMGATIDVQTKGGMTPLLSAASRPDNLEVVKYLVSQGADVNKVVGNRVALELASGNNDLAMARFLVEQGAIVNPKVRTAPILTAAWRGDVQLVKYLIDQGADVNVRATPKKRVERPLNLAFYGQNPEVAKLLIDRGADLHARSPRGSHGTPPMVFAAYFENQNTSVAQLLLDKGVDPNTEANDGLTALTWARKHGNVELEKILLKAGAKEPSRPSRMKSVPDNQVHHSGKQRQQQIRDAVQRSVDVLQRGSDGFLANGGVKKSGCVSCHHQTLPAIVFNWALARGFQVDQASLAHQYSAQLKHWRVRTESAFNMRRPQADAPVLLGYGLDALAAANYEPDSLTEAMVWYLHNTQDETGYWMVADNRPPVEDSSIQGTAYGIRSLVNFPLPGREEESAQRIATAASWLEDCNPLSFNQRVYQLFGLSWAGYSAKQNRRFVDSITSLQRDDGGWAQLDGLTSDAWATGQALVALNRAGDVKTSDPIYQRGLDFLLKTQFEDGSWWVKSRSWPFQPHFDSHFPHGRDQWVSSGGTAWAAMALLLAQPLNDEDTTNSTFDWSQLDRLSREAIARAAMVDEGNSIPTSNTVAVDFGSQIKPVLERSCVGCHSGGRPKGGLDMTDRIRLLKGGNSNDDSVVPGNGKQSQLLRFASDAVEDLEMPPLNKRKQYPALTPEELNLLKLWIDRGAVWPANVTLKPNQ